MAGALRTCAGGIASLAAFVAEHGEAIEFDLRRYWQCAITDITWRQLRTFLHHLPTDSATARALHGDAAAWGITEHLLAAITDAVQWANYQRAAGKGTKPRPIERPGADSKRRTVRHGSTDLPPEAAVELLERARTGTLHNPQ